MDEIFQNLNLKLSFQVNGKIAKFVVNDVRKLNGKSSFPCELIIHKNVPLFGDKRIAGERVELSWNGHNFLHQWKCA